MFAVGVGNNETLAKADLIYPNTESISYSEIRASFENK
jgi:hypothetical protein